MGEVRAVGGVVSVSWQVATAQAYLLDARERMYATAITCLILRPGPHFAAARPEGAMP